MEFGTHLERSHSYVFKQLRNLDYFYTQGLAGGLAAIYIGGRMVGKRSPVLVPAAGRWYNDNNVTLRRNR